MKAFIYRSIIGPYIIDDIATETLQLTYWVQKYFGLAFDFTLT